MTIKLSALMIEVNTVENKKLKGLLEFNKNGLTIVRAENSMGKSTCVQSVIYALGLESMLIKKHDIPLPPALKSFISSHSDELSKDLEYEVSSSNVYLEIENEKGRVVTLKRGVKNLSKDYKLIEVYDGPILTKKSTPIENPLELYARDGGSAKNPFGFYNWLEKFIGWELPSVALMNGNFTNLYIENIAPLFIVEQKAGWGQIQANTPHFQIRDVKKRVIEFVLSLDSYKNYQDYLRINAQIERAIDAWRNNYSEIDALARLIHGRIINLSKTMPTSFEDQVNANIIFIDKNNNKLGILDYLKYLSEELIEQRKKYDLNIDNLSSELKSKLTETEQQIYYQDKFIQELDLNLKKLNLEIEDNKDRLVDYESEYKNFTDIRKIKNMGGRGQSLIDSSICPTCTQHTNGKILRSDIDSLYMSVDENIEFLKSEMKTVEVINKNLIEKTQLIQEDRRSIANKLDENRKQVRLIKDSLVDAGKLPSKVTLHQILKLEEEIQQVEDLKNEFDSTLENFQEIFTSYSKLKLQLPSTDDFLSEMDKQKLNYLSASIKNQLEKYGFNSFKLSELKISYSSYHPALADIDWYFDVSASDNVRGIWAYTLGLHETCQKYNLKNNLGFVIFDEPRQHSAKGDSFNAFLNECISSKMNGTQSIVFTSEPFANVEEFSKLGNVKFINYNDNERVIK